MYGMKKRSSGILLHISSLASPWGIGTLGEAALRFVDFLHEAGVSYWQMLPVGPVSPVGQGNSPYQSESAFAGNPLFIDLDLLIKDGLLDAGFQTIRWGAEPGRVDFDTVRAGRIVLLRRAFDAAPPQLLAKAAAFAHQYPWVEDYCLYTSIKNEQNGAPFWEWSTPLALREPVALDAAKQRLAGEMAYHAFVQYLFFSQFNALKSYAARQGVGLIGDLPIYVSEDSADVWANRKLFLLGETGRPEKVAGVGPDAFSPDGQRWGNPLYDWDAVIADDWRWWIARVRASLSMFDMVRIDHFRGFDSYWAIDTTSASACEGEWLDGPGIKLFDTLKFVFGTLPIIAEDLGILTPRVHALLEQTGFPGMKVLQFGFERGVESDYLPHRHIKNAVCYTGTHDNDTLRGWLDALDGDTANYFRDYLGAAKGDELRAGIRAAFASVCDLAIVPMQDLLGLSSAARMNTPGTVGPHNWSWRLPQGALSKALAKEVRQLNELYYRI